MEAEMIRQVFDLDNTTAEILYNRGYDNAQDIRYFLNPKLSYLQNPSYIPNIDKVKGWIDEHMLWGNKILIYGDYDVDGVTSSAILYKAFKDFLNYDNVDVLISNRFRDGYGLSNRAVDIMKEKGADLIITLDCGISNHKEIDYANSKDIDVIVIDHHESNNPPDTPFIDLKVESGNYKFIELSGAGITWKVAQYLTNNKLHGLLDIVALSTIADVVPLRKENRVIVKHGLDKINNSSCMGIQMLKTVAGLRKKLSAGNIGYNVAPLINAQGRLDDNTRSFKLLTTKNDSEAMFIAKELYQINERRKTLTKRAFKEINKSINKEDSFIVGQVGVGAGIVGLIAGDLKEEHGKPTIVFSEPNENGICKGSGRSVKPLHLKNLLDDLSHLTEGHGGHELACGLSIHKDNIKEFKFEVLKRTADIKYRQLKYDLKIDTKDITPRLIRELDIFQPCGAGNPTPKFLIKGNVTNINLTTTGEHVIYELNGVDGIAFSSSHKIDRLMDNGKVVGTLGFNSYSRGNKNPIQIITKKII